MSDERVAAGLERLDLPDTPVARALLTLLDQTVSRLDHDGRIPGVWIGGRQYVSDLPDEVLDAFEASSEFFVTDLVGADVRPRILGAIEQCLVTGQPVSVDFTSRATGRLLYLQGSCAPSGGDEVIWITRDVTTEVGARRRAEDRADIEAMVGDAVRSLLDASPDQIDRQLPTALRTVAGYYGATSAFLHRFRGVSHVEIVAQ